MSNTDQLGAVLYEAETNWGENVTTFGTHRLPHIGPIAPLIQGLTQSKIDPNRMNQYLQDGSEHIRGVMGGSFKLIMYATGHGSAVTGAFTVDALETFFSYIFSGAGAGGAGGTVTSSGSGMTATGGTAAAPTTSAASGIPAGGLISVGTLGDNRGNAQVVAVSSHATSTATLLTALDGAPNNGDVIRSGANLYLPETPTSSTVTSLRFALCSANQVYEAHGCWPMAIALKTPVGQLPTWEIDIGVSWWQLNAASVAFPSAVTSNQYSPAPFGPSGSLFVNDVGQNARGATNKRVYRNFSIDMKLGVVPLPGPGGFNSYQNIVGARRVPTDIRWKWTEDADARTGTPVLESYWLNGTPKHGLITFNTVPGQQVAAYAPNLRIVGDRPKQISSGSINSFAIELEANTGGTTTTDLTASATRFFLG
jgi:hypothetical protein